MDGHVWGLFPVHVLKPVCTVIDISALTFASLAVIAYNFRLILLDSISSLLGVVFPDPP